MLKRGSFVVGFNLPSYHPLKVLRIYEIDGNFLKTCEVAECFLSGNMRTGGEIRYMYFLS